MRPAGRFICNHPGCTVAVEWVADVYTVDAQVGMLQRTGWRVGLGCATCPAHTAPAPRPTRPVVLSLEERLRASLRADDRIEQAGGHRAALAAQVGGGGRR